MAEEKDKNNQKEKKTLKRYIKLKTLIIIVVLLIFNSYAWFIFATKVSTGLSAHVTSWDVTFLVGDEGITDIEIDVGKIYPGMEPFTKVITAKNLGETKANLTYQYQSLTLLGETYTVGENCTQEELNEKIQNEYPFKINVSIDKSHLESGENSYGTFTITVEWPYESGDDEKDTYWGQKAYEFYEQNPDEISLHLKLLLIASQVN